MLTPPLLADASHLPTGGHGVPAMPRRDRSIRCQLQALPLWIPGELVVSPLVHTFGFTDMRLMSLSIDLPLLLASYQAEPQWQVSSLQAEVLGPVD